MYNRDLSPVCKCNKCIIKISPQFVNELVANTDVLKGLETPCLSCLNYKHITGNITIDNKDRRCYFGDLYERVPIANFPNLRLVIETGI